jgi:hypothetical protein
MQCWPSKRLRQSASCQKKNNQLSKSQSGKSGPEVKTQKPVQKLEESAKKLAGRKRGRPRKHPAKDLQPVPHGQPKKKKNVSGPLPLTNAEWDRIEACATANWSAIWNAREEEDELKDKKKKELEAEKKKKKLDAEKKKSKDLTAINDEGKNSSGAGARRKCSKATPLVVGVRRSMRGML